MVTKSRPPFDVSSGFSPFAKSGSGWFAVWFTAILLLLCPNHQSWSAEISVSASLQPATTNVGEPVQLHVTINGSQRVAEIPSVRIDGAQVQYIGQATQMRLVNTELSVSLTHRYLVSPGRVGELEVPPVEVTVDGRKYQTEPLKLKVLEVGQEPGAALQTMPFAEIQLPRNFAYVGEAVPVEVRLGVPSDTRWRIERMPEFETDAFTKTTFQQPQQRQENRQGRDFDVCSAILRQTPWARFSTGSRMITSRLPSSSAASFWPSNGLISARFPLKASPRLSEELSGAFISMPLPINPRLRRASQSP